MRGVRHHWRCNESLTRRKALRFLLGLLDLRLCQALVTVTYESRLHKIWISGHTAILLQYGEPASEHQGYDATCISLHVPSPP